MNKQHISIYIYTYHSLFNSLKTETETENSTFPQASS